MKKFLSICLVALCSVSAMYAQETPTPSTDSRRDVSCGTEVTVEATSKTGFYHFVEWQIQNGGRNGLLLTVDRNGNLTSGTNNYGATVSVSTNPTVDGSGSVDGTGNEKSTLSLNSLSSALIDAATSGLVFEAFFAIDKYTITGEPNDNTMGEVTGSGTTEGSNTLTLTANVKQDAPCARFDHWELDDENHTVVPGDSEDHPNQLTVRPEATWAHNSTHKYIAVFKTKTVDITVTTADDDMGTVRIVTPAPANN